MSTYINPNTGKVFRVDNLDAPGFLKDFLNHELVIRNLTAKTVNNYYIHSRSFIRWLQVRDEPITAEEFYKVPIEGFAFEQLMEVERNDVVDYLSFSHSVLDNKSDTRSAKLTALKALFGYYCENGKMDENPALGIKAPKKEKLIPKYLSEEEGLVLLSAIDGPMAERDYCMITFFINCGMRLSELVNINLQHIRGDTLKLYGKGRKERVIYLNAACIDALEKYMSARSTYPIIDKDALWLSKRTGKRLSPRRVEQIVSESIAKAGLSGKGYSTHKLRHTAATLLYNSGSADILELKEILGHENTSTTEIYTHLNQQNLRKALHNAPLAGVTRGTMSKNQNNKDV